MRVGDPFGLLLRRRHLRRRAHGTSITAHTAHSLRRCHSTMGSSIDTTNTGFRTDRTDLLASPLLRPKDFRYDWQYQAVDDEGVGDTKIPRSAYLEEWQEREEYGEDHILDGLARHMPFPRLHVLQLFYFAQKTPSRLDTLIRHLLRFLDDHTKTNDVDDAERPDNKTYGDKVNCGEYVFDGHVLQ